MSSRAVRAVSHGPPEPSREPRQIVLTMAASSALIRASSTATRAPLERSHACRPRSCRVLRLEQIERLGERRQDAVPGNSRRSHGIYQQCATVVAGIMHRDAEQQEAHHAWLARSCGFRPYFCQFSKQGRRPLFNDLVGDRVQWSPRSSAKRPTATESVRGGRVPAGFICFCYASDVIIVFHFYLQIRDKRPCTRTQPWLIRFASTPPQAEGLHDPREEQRRLRRRVRRRHRRPAVRTRVDRARPRGADQPAAPRRVRLRGEHRRRRRHPDPDRRTVSFARSPPRLGIDLPPAGQLRRRRHLPAARDRSARRVARD